MSRFDSKQQASKYDTPAQVEFLKPIPDGAGGSTDKWSPKFMNSQNTSTVWGMFRFTKGDTFNLGGALSSFSDATFRFHAENNIQPDDSLLIYEQRYRIDGPANDVPLHRSEKIVNLTRDDRGASHTSEDAS